MKAGEYFGKVLTPTPEPPTPEPLPPEPPEPAVFQGSDVSDAVFLGVRASNDSDDAELVTLDCEPRNGSA